MSRRDWVWLVVIVLLLLARTVYLGITEQIVSYLRPGTCVLGFGETCFMSGAT